MPIEGVCVAFGDNMLDPDPTWTRLDSTPNLVASYSTRRGRQDEFDKTGTGTATVQINDTAGVFDPTFAGSPYYDSIDGKQAAIGLWNPLTETWHTIFRGFVDGYTYDVEPSGVVTRVELELADGLDYLAGAEAAPGTAGLTPPPPAHAGDVFYDNALVDDRILEALTDAGWPLELATIFSGNVNVKESVYSPGTAFLQIVQDAADAEFPGVANFYVSRDGKMTFHGRLARFDPEGTAASASEGAWEFTRWKAGDGAVALGDPEFAQLRGLAFARSRKNIINAGMATPMRRADAPLTGAQIEAQIVVDPTSIDKYGVHSWSAPDLLCDGHTTADTTDLEETRKFAEHYVLNYAEPQTRVTRLVFRSIHPTDPRAAATWALLCGVEVSDTVQLTANFPGGGGFVGNEFYVEGVSYDVRPLSPAFQDVTLTLDVSPTAYYESGPFVP